jgi:hypothetical protein
LFPSRGALAVDLLAVVVGTVWTWNVGLRAVDLVRAPLDESSALLRGAVVVTRVTHVALLALTVLLVVVGWSRGQV